MVHAAPDTRPETLTPRLSVRRSRRRRRSRREGRDDTDQGRGQGRRLADEASELSRARVPSERRDIAAEHAVSCLSINNDRHVHNVYIFLQCFDTVGWVIWPVKTSPDMIYNVFGGTLNLALSIYLYSS